MTRRASKFPRFFRPSWQSSFVVGAGFLASCSPVAPPAPPAAGGKLPDIMQDPYEPVNRGIWKVNEGLLVGVIRPAGRAYRAVVRPPVRESISHFARNATYPGRLINNSLQGRWKGAGDESLRFLTNTTVGVAGFFDVATKWNIPKSDAAFAQTFAGWGWKPKNYLMVPALGPSDSLHLVGRGADELVKPWNYDYPYTIASYTTAFNAMAETSEDASRFVLSEADPYAGIKYIWSYTSKETPPDWTLRGAPDMATLETFGVAAISTKDPEFARLGKELGVKLPSTGKVLKFNVWLQKENAPLVYITPGLGAHRLSQINLTLAEALYQNGYSVVTTSGVFHPEFMEHASTAPLPAYPPVDSHDLLVSLTGIDQLLQKKYPDKFGKRALIGCSMGGFETLYLAAHEKKADPELLHFDRYVTINAPVDLYYGIDKLDDYYNAPSAWPAAQRQAIMNNCVHKVAKLSELPPTVTVPPFDATESKYLVGLSFRLTLRDTIFSSQSRHNMGVLKSPISQWHRDEVYQEIYGFSFEEYFSKFALPYYRGHGVSAADITREVNLRNSASGLSGQSKVRVILNRNDFLLAPGDVSWLQSTLGSSRVKVFPNGGHLGNIGSSPVQQEVLRSLGGLK